LAFEVVTERRVGISRKAGNFGIQSLRGRLEGGEVGGGIAVAKGVVGDEIETGFHGVAEFLVQGGLVSHG
jgi:hypothetical protein